MADDIKVYEPEVIPDNPFPQGTGASDTTVVQQSAGQVYSAQQTQEQNFPTRRIATEVIGAAINTHSRRILGEFQFTQQGAVQIGQYQEGVSGDVRISPSGIVARDSSGNETIAIDGETGSAVFAGELQSGTVVTGQIAVGDDAIQIDGENRRIIFYDQNGIPSIVIGNV